MKKKKSKREVVSEKEVQLKHEIWKLQDTIDQLRVQIHNGRLSSDDRVELNQLKNEILKKDTQIQNLKSAQELHQMKYEALMTLFLETIRALQGPKEIK